MPPAEREALRALKRDTEINLKKADKGTTTVVRNTQDKIKEGQTLLDNKDNYRPLASPMVTETNHKVKQLITDLHIGDHIDDKSSSDSLLLTKRDAYHCEPVFFFFFTRSDSHSLLILY